MLERVIGRARRKGPATSISSRGRTTSASVSASTARSATSRCCRSSCRRRWSRASRSSPAWTSPSTACRRTAASARRSRIGGSTCGARPTRRSTARRRSCACSTTAACAATSKASACAASSLDTMRELIHRPEGIVLITGPTGSGKTSTLYASLAELVETGKNIVTIEDPGRIRAAGREPGADQRQGRVHVREGAARRAAAGSRRDHGRRDSRRRDARDGDRSVADRAPGALDAAHQQRGGDHRAAGRDGARAVSARVQRARDRRAAAGAPDLRHVPRPKCRRAPALRAMFRAGGPQTFFRGMGCRDCRGTGFRGRIGIFEMLRMTEEISHAGPRARAGRSACSRRRAAPA